MAATTITVGGRRYTPATYQAYLSTKKKSTGYSPSGAAQLYAQQQAQAMSSLENLSGQERQDIMDRYAALRGQLTSQLVGSGLQTGTMLGSVMTGATKAQGADLRTLADMLAREREDVRAQYTQGQASALQADAALRAQAVMEANRLTLQGQTTATQQSIDAMRAGTRLSAGTRTGGISTRISSPSNRMGVLPGSSASYRLRFA